MSPCWWCSGAHISEVMLLLGVQGAGKTATCSGAQLAHAQLAPIRCEEVKAMKEVDCGRSPSAAINYSQPVIN